MDPGTLSGTELEDIKDCLRLGSTKKVAPQIASMLEHLRAFTRSQYEPYSLNIDYILNNCEKYDVCVEDIGACIGFTARRLRPDKFTQMSEHTSTQSKADPHKTKFSSLQQFC